MVCGGLDSVAFLLFPSILSNLENRDLKDRASSSKPVLLILLLKEVGSARLRDSDIHLISPKTPAPQYQPIDRKKRKGKVVEHYSSDRAA